MERERKQRGLSSLMWMMLSKQMAYAMPSWARFRRIMPSSARVIFGCLVVIMFFTILSAIVNALAATNGGHWQ